MILEYLKESLVSEKQATGDGSQPWCSDNGCEPSASNCSNDNAEGNSSEEWYELALEYTEPVFKEFARILNSFGGKDTKRMSKIKPEKSFVSKVNRGKSPCLIHDVLRGAILPPDVETTEDIVYQMRKKLKVFEFEKKEKGENEFGYYGSYHFKIELSNGEIAEIQVMPRKMWAYKKASHKIYGKWRERDVNDLTPSENSEREKDKQVSKTFFTKANQNKIK